MDNWRGQKGENYNQETQKTRSHNKRPPVGSLPATVPSWEKKFCSSIGSLPWRKFLEMKKYVYLYEDVVQWNDSAGEEAFNNAKYRFWAEINGLPCDISLPGPDIYIDEIDWNSEIDPELILDLEREPIVSDSEVSIVADSVLLNQPVVCTGWGDEEEDQGKATNSFSGLANCDRNVNHNDYPLESSCPQSNRTLKEDGWGDCWNASWGSDKWENNVYDCENFDAGRTNGVWGTWNRNLSNGKVDAWHMSR